MKRILTAVAGLLLLFSACHRGKVQTVDLTTVIPFGELVREHREPALSDRDAPEFESGWSWPEKDANGRDFRWATGARSSLRFYCASPRDIRLRLSLRPFRYPGAPKQGLLCLLNGSNVGKASLPARTNLEFLLPARLLRAGENNLDFHWDDSTRVSDVLKSGDRRKLAAAVSSILFDGLEEGGCGTIVKRNLSKTAVGVTPLPSVSETRLTMRPGRAARLRLGGEGLDRLEILIRQEGEDLHKIKGSRHTDAVFELKNSGGPLQIALRTGRNSTVRLQRAELSWVNSGTALGNEAGPSGRKPNIILYVVDTLRADRLGCYGGPKGISKALDQFASDGVLFESAVAQSSWTKPSMVSILSGLLSTEHGVRSREQVIPERVKLISEYLQEEGYQTAAFTTNAYLIPSAHFNRGFETFRFSRLSSHKLTNEGIDWLKNQGKDQPLFLWLHSVDPHAPYQPEKAFRKAWAPDVPAEFGSVEHIRSLGGRPPEETTPFISPFRALYDAEIAQNDEAFGELLSYLRKTGRYDDTCIIFVSDHGEEFWEHEVNGHGWDLFEEVLHVPLVIKMPESSRKGERVSAPVQHIDLLPTLLHIAGLRVPEKLRGQDLFKGGWAPDRPIFSEMSYEGREGFALRSGFYKFIQPLSRGFLPGPQLFKLETDRGEKDNFVGDEPVLASWLAQEGRVRMALRSAIGSAGRPLALSADERRGLEALGYLGAPPETH